MSTKKLERKEQYCTLCKENTNHDFLEHLFIQKMIDNLDGRKYLDT